MKLSLAPLLTAAGLALASSSSSQQQQQQQQQTTIHITIPASHSVPNPGALPPSTRATLSALHRPAFAAPLSAVNAFVFRNVTPGSYLADVHSPTHGFAPLRVDVSADGSGGLVVQAWETYRGNDWDNKGEQLAVRTTTRAAGDHHHHHHLQARALGAKNYFTERQGFSLMTILGNPMILMGIVSMGLFVGMPYLMDNMDPEMKAEFEARQKQGPMGGLLGGGGGGGGAGAAPDPMNSVASFLAGSGSGSSSSSQKEPVGGSGKKGQAGRR